MKPKMAMNQASHPTQNTIAGIASAVKTLLLLLLLIPAAAQAEDYIWADNGDGTCTITDYTGPGGNITIPDTLDDLTVTVIGNRAFYDCTSLTNVTIGNNVTAIGYGPFTSCDNLLNITVAPANPAFMDIDGVLFDKNQTELIQCPATKAGTYVIPDSVIYIGDSAFESCDSLTNVIIEGNVTHIGNFAFRDCVSLNGFIIPDGVTYIGDHAFEYCISLDSLAIPDSVTEIGNYAFDFCSSLTDVIIPDGVTYIGNYAFSLCSSLKTITIPDSVITIGFRAFFWCTGLTEVTIGNSVTTIGSQAFSNCDILKNISVKADNPVYSSLNGVLFNKTQTELIRYPAGKVGGYIVPDSVISIREEAFLLSTSLTNIIIGKNVTDIGNWAFDRCELLNGVYFKGDTPTLGYEVFILTHATVYYIPTTFGWSTSFGYRPTAIWPLSPADVDANYEINLTDFAMLAGQWLQTGCDELNDWCQKTDVDQSGGVDPIDLTILAENWLGFP